MYYTKARARRPGLAMGGAQPDTARNVQGLRLSVSLLLESRGVGIGRLHIQRRVHSHVVALRDILHSAAANAADVAAMRARLRAETMQAACKGELTVLAAQTPLTREVLMLDPVTGADKPVQVQWLSSRNAEMVRRQRPCVLAGRGAETRCAGYSAGLQVHAGRKAGPGREHWLETRASKSGPRARNIERLVAGWCSGALPAALVAPSGSVPAAEPAAGQPGGCRIGARFTEQLLCQPCVARTGKCGAGHRAAGGAFKMIRSAGRFDPGWGRTGPAPFSVAVSGGANRRAVNPARRG